MKKQIAWIFGGAALIGIGMLGSLDACSSNNGGTDAGAKDAAADTKADVANTQDSGGMDAGNDVSTVDCGTIPKLHPTEAGTIFCGYPADGGASFSCATGQQCCLGGEISKGVYAPEQCSPFSTAGGGCDNPAPDGGSPIQCGQTSDCTANNVTGVCCLQGASVPAMVAGCSYYKSQGGNAIMCEQGTACSGATDIQICSSQADCPTGKTCTAMKWKLYQIGACL